jgi:inositol-1,3,4-trisphosphate 5/6-kinase / inositol-tetrakisphosphate 1-kinase
MVSGGSVGAEGEGDLTVVEREESVPTPARDVVVGYALTLKKAKSFLQPKLRGLARYGCGEPRGNSFLALSSV